MAIYLICPSCHAEMKHTLRKCLKCQTAIPAAQRNYRIRLVNKERKMFTKRLDSLPKAKSLHDKWIQEIKDHGEPLEINPPMTLAMVWEKYLVSKKAKEKKSLRDDQNRYEQHLKQRFGEKRIDRITVSEVDEFLDGLRVTKTRYGRPYAPATIRQVQMLLQGIMTFAIERDYLKGPNVAKKVSMDDFDNRVENPLTEADKKTFLAACNSDPNRWATRVIQFGYFTGARKGKILEATWDQFDFEGRTWRLEIKSRKKNAEIVIPLNSCAYDVLADAKVNQVSRFVFPASTGRFYGGFDKVWQRWRKRYGLEKYRFHDLRHTFATYYANAEGADIYKLKELMGHQAIQMTERYSHLFNKTLVRASEAAAMHLK